LKELEQIQNPKKTIFTLFCPLPPMFFQLCRDKPRPLRLISFERFLENRFSP